MENIFSKNIMELRYSWDKPDGTKETWKDISERVVKNVLTTINFKQKKEVENELIEIVSKRKFIPGGRFLAQAGRDYHQCNNCFCLRAEDSREGWGDLANKATIMLMSGGGVGINYSEIRPSGSILKRSGGTSSGPVPLMKVINEIGRGVMSGGKRRSALYASLKWNHPDIEEFIILKNWIPEIRKIKEKDFDFPAPMDMTNISVILDKDFFNAFNNSKNPNHELAKKVYWMTINRMLKTSEPGFQVDYNNKNESLRNACTEIVSEDDSDVCCLGSINLPEIVSIEELKHVTYLSQLFLLIGTEYSDTPTKKIKEIRNKNRRTGLGIMGVHEWLISRGYKYDENKELEKWLKIWKIESDNSANEWADKFSFNRPVAKRACAPNGTTAIVGGMTTGGIEPIYSVAYQRRYITPTGWKKQYVIDFVAEKLYEKGIDISTIEDAYTLSLDVEKRINFQSFIQKYIDNSISSTINIPSFDSPGNNSSEKFGNILMKYLPNIRGITVYADGSRGGQPLTPVDFNYALGKKGVVFEANEECNTGSCGV